MNRHTRFNLILAVILISAAFAGPARSAVPSGVRSTLPNPLQSIPGTTADWWSAVQEDLHLSGYQSTRPMAGISGLSLIPNWGDEGDQVGAEFGFSVASAGDVNGDGYDDVIVGARYYDYGQTDEGAAAVYHGSASGLALIPNWMGEGDQEYAHFGSSVGTAGDVNGDGYDDVIVGAPGYSNGQDTEGAAAVYHGSASGLSIVPNWGDEGDQDDAVFGWSVGTAGDVNGDGFADVIISAPWYTNGQTYEGAAAVYHGSASGLSLTPNWGDEGDQEYANFGYSVASAGDVNGDGFSDVIVSAPNYDHEQTDEGAAAVYHGSASGLSLAPNWGDEGDQAGAQFGSSVGTAGDVNGDGYADIIVGARFYDHGQTDEGAAVVYHGSASGLSILPNWGDEGDQDYAHFGYSVGTAGDVNGDGFADVIVGAAGYDNGQVNEGAAVVYHGSATGLSLTINWGDEGDQEGAEFGHRVGAAGDVNGDGYSDVIVGVPRYDHGQTDEGAAAVFHGSGYYYTFLPVVLRNH